jgi:hypothetical protein
VIDAQFGVYRAAGQAECAGRLPGGADGRAEDRAGQQGRTGEEGFFEGGAVGCGGLVEDGGDGQPAVVQQAVDAQLRAGQVLLDQQGFTFGAAGGRQDVPDPPGRGPGGGRVLCAQDALSRRMRDGQVLVLDVRPAAGYAAATSPARSTCRRPARRPARRDPRRHRHRRLLPGRLLRGRSRRGPAAAGTRVLRPALEGGLPDWRPAGLPVTAGISA